MKWQHLVVLDGTDLIKLVAAFLAGLALGVEREYHDKSAGMRTITLICVGAALFVIFSQRIPSEAGRVAAQIVTGVGFLGAGVILQRRGQVVGLTTASTIWVAAALGVGMGLGALLFTAIATVLVILVLSALPAFESIFQRAVSFRSYKITVTLDPSKPARLKKAFTDLGLKVREESQVKGKESIVLMWYVSGKPSLHRQICDAMIKDAEIKEFDV
ncbi:MAG: MgtC/SapB family protein [Nitrososphaerales archaeon]